MNITLANKLLSYLENEGIKDIILCAGARNSPFLFLLENTSQFNTYNFFEERSAAFFALGLSLAGKSPTAIITTSGTAVAELLPAVIESYYSNIPLILVTADRPAPYRGTGAPQSIEQVGIFSNYATTFDIQKIDFEFSKIKWSQKSSLHLNICFDEPLIDEPLICETLIGETLIGEPINSDLKNETTTFDFSNKESKINKFCNEISDENTIYNSEFIQNLQFYKTQWDFFISKAKSPLIIVSGLKEQDRKHVSEFLIKYPGPVYIESISGLKNMSDINSRILSGDRFIKKCFDSHFFDGVIRIGSVPTTRIWRDLEDSLKSLPVFSISSQSWKGLSRNSLLVQNLGFLQFILNTSLAFKWNNQIRLLDRFYTNQIAQILKTHPTSEQGLIFEYSTIVENNPLYLGNSKPIREWDSFSANLPNILSFQNIAANRGANGIDGQISTYLGWSKDFPISFSLFGDLTTLYDLSSLWITPQLPNQKIRHISIMNNKGGLIFEKMFKKEIFLNRHEISFEKWAEMWNWNYQLWNEIPKKYKPNLSSIIELAPDLNASENFNIEYESIWKKQH